MIYVILAHTAEFAHLYLGLLARDWVGFFFPSFHPFCGSVLQTCKHHACGGEKTIWGNWFSPATKQSILLILPELLIISSLSHLTIGVLGWQIHTPTSGFLIKFGLSGRVWVLLPEPSWLDLLSLVVSLVSSENLPLIVLAFPSCHFVLSSSLLFCVFVVMAAAFWFFFLRLDSTSLQHNQGRTSFWPSCLYLLSAEVQGVHHVRR